MMEMDKKLGTTSLHKNFFTFFGYAWDKTMSVDEFVVGFHSRLDKVNKLNLNEEHKDNLLQKKANLDALDRNIIIRLSGRGYSLQVLLASLRNAYRQEGLPSSSMNTVRRRGSRLQFNCRPQTSTNNSNSETLFYTYVWSQNQNAAPSAIVHSGTCASGEGKVALHHAMDPLSIRELADDKIIQLEHQLGPSDEPRKTLCTVRVLFHLNTSETRDPTLFHIRFGVIDGNLLFHIWPPSLKAMGTTPSFSYNNLSLVIHHNIHRLDLISTYLISDYH